MRRAQRYPLAHLATMLGTLVRSRDAVLKSQAKHSTITLGCTSEALACSKEGSPVCHTLHDIDGPMRNCMMST